MSLTERGK
jgi:hypothetical protein